MEGETPIMTTSLDVVRPYQLEPRAAMLRNIGGVSSESEDSDDGWADVESDEEILPSDDR